MSSAEPREIFNSYMRLKDKVQDLAAIIQNPNTYLSEIDFQQFLSSNSSIKEELEELEEEVLEFYNIGR